MSESETWSPLNNGRLAATATTADALAVLGRQFEAVVPVQIGYSRGADMVVVDRGIASINQLAGKVLAASQFNESEFFIRYLAQEAGVPVEGAARSRRAPGGRASSAWSSTRTPSSPATPTRTSSPGAAPRLNGCVGWTPRTDEVVEASNGTRQGAGLEPQPAGRSPTCSRSTRASPRQHPDMVRGLVHGLLEGNRLLRDQPGRAPRASSPRPSTGREAEARDELVARAPREPAGEPRLLRRHDRLRRLVRRHLPVVGARLRQP